MPEETLDEGIEQPSEENTKWKKLAKMVAAATAGTYAALGLADISQIDEKFIPVMDPVNAAAVAAAAVAGTYAFYNWTGKALSGLKTVTNKFIHYFAEDEFCRKHKNNAPLRRIYREDGDYITPITKRAAKPSSLAGLVLIAAGILGMSKVVETGKLSPIPPEYNPIVWVDELIEPSWRNMDNERRRNLNFILETINPPSKRI